MRRGRRDDVVKSRRCSICSIQYPPFVEVCRICGEETWPMFKTGPDEDWEERLAREIGEGVFVDPPRPIAYAVQHPPDVQLPLHIRDGRLWISHAGLIDAGYRYLEDGSIVFVGGRFYELAGYWEAQGLWWVEEIVTDGCFGEVTPEDIINGGDYET